MDQQKGSLAIKTCHYCDRMWSHRYRKTTSQGIGLHPWHRRVPEKVYERLKEREAIPLQRPINHELTARMPRRLAS